MLRTQQSIRPSARQRQKIIDDFVDHVFTGIHDDDAAVLAGWMRQLPSEWADDPSCEQADAWAELAELVADRSFRDAIRARALSGAGGSRLEFGLNIRSELLKYAGRAVDEGIAPQSPRGKVVLDRIVPPDLPTTEYEALLGWLETVADTRVERYWQLLSLVNGETPAQPAVPAFAWLIAALRGHSR